MILTCYIRSFVIVFEKYFSVLLYLHVGRQTFVSIFQNVLFCLSVFACCITLIGVWLGVSPSFVSVFENVSSSISVFACCIV